MLTETQKYLRKVRNAVKRREKGSRKQDARTKGIKRARSTDGLYVSARWRVARYEALKRADGRCECCGASVPDGVRLHVDHIKPRSRFPKLAFDPSNLQVLCEDCNIGKGDWDATDWRDHLKSI